MMWMTKAKQATTIATQIVFAVLDLAVEMSARPWIVELSKKLLQTANAMPQNDLLSVLVNHQVFKVKVAFGMNESSTS